MALARHVVKEHFPWIETPLVVSAPMRLISTAALAVEVSKAGMYGFSYQDSLALSVQLI